MKTDENCEITRHGEKTAWKTQEIPESIEQWEEKERRNLWEGIWNLQDLHMVYFIKINIQIKKGNFEDPQVSLAGTWDWAWGWDVCLGKGQILFSNGVHTILTSEYDD